jgi:putative ABC transport system ATP-binding protein
MRRKDETMDAATNGEAVGVRPPSPPTPVYRLRGLSKSYGDGATAVRAVDGIDLEIATGELVVIAGPSGSGKSTLLQLLGALDPPSAGSLEFEGRELAPRGDGELADLRLDRIGFVFQQFNLIPTLSAMENVELAMAPTGVPAAERTARTAQLLDRVGLASRADHLPSQLSGGEQQRVAIARALANGPDVLLADEPTGNLDSQTGESILTLLRQLSVEGGLTVIVITHDPAVAATAPRVVRLADGRISSDERIGAGAAQALEGARR